MEPLEAIARPQPLHQHAQRAIRDYILNNNLVGGDHLPGEMELARQLGISRNSVREAIRALESVGILDVRRGKGVFVREFSFEPLLEGLFYGLLVDLRSVEELLDIRCVLEKGMIEDAVATMTDDIIAQLGEVIDRMRDRASKGLTFPEEDRRFHALVYQRVGNESFLRLLDVFWLANRAASRQLEQDGDPERTWRDHARILDAIAMRDATLAREALELHYTDLKQRLAAAKAKRVPTS